MLVLWINGRIQDLGTLPGGTQSVAEAVNASGQVVGGSQQLQDAGQPLFVWSRARGMLDLGVLPKGFL